MESEEETRRSKRAENLCDTCIHNPTRGGKRDRVKEFSKKVIVCLTLAWFVGLVTALSVIVCELVTTGQTTALSDTLLYIGAPMTGGVLGYLVKSAVENREKIRGSAEEDEDLNPNIDTINENIYTEEQNL